MEDTHHPSTTVTATISDDEPPISAVNHPSPPPTTGSKPTKKKSKNRLSDDTPSSSSSSSHNHHTNCNYKNFKNNNYSHRNSNYNNNSTQKGIRIGNKRRNPKFSVRRSATDVDAIAFPLGMSIAAVLSQVLERKDITNEKTSVDQLSEICTSAVRESLSNVFGDKFDAFARNFEKSFGSTLSTLSLIRNSPVDIEEHQRSHSNIDVCNFNTMPTIGLNKGEPSSSCNITECFLEPRKGTFGQNEQLKRVEEVEDNHSAASLNQELSVRGHMTQHLASNNLGNLSMVSTIKKSVVEQTRANDLKSVEIGLIMRKLKLKETQLALNSDSNFLERCKLTLGASRTSFKAEKFKTQLEETRHSELLRTCADFLVAGLLIMLGCLGYGVYAFSYDKIYQLTNSCSPSTESKSWWIPRPMASFNSGLQTLNCQVQVYSRMLFGVLMILAIAYVLIQRSAISRDAMPVTFIVLLLGAGCGFAGKFCVDTLGGDGSHWLIYWEFLCALHFFANVFTSFLFHILNGAIQVSPGTKSHPLFPFWVRRWLFYLVLLLVPISCGLLPFASPRKWWEDHFSKLIRNYMLAAYDENYDDESGLH